MSKRNKSWKRIVANVLYVQRSLYLLSSIVHVRYDSDKMAYDRRMRALGDLYSVSVKQSGTIWGRFSTLGGIFHDETIL